MKTNQIITASLIGITACTGAALTSSTIYADNDSAVDQITITVPTACTMSGSIVTGQEHSAELTPGTYSGATGSTYENGIGKTTLTTYCNDNNGFSIYAIGFTSNTEGDNTLVGTSASGNATISTKVYESTDTQSNWSMKVTKVTDTTQTYNPNNMTVTNSFNTWHTVPDDYTKVAEYKSTTEPATTDTTLGAKLETTYATYISTTQPADTYTGQVKYVMVHPYDHTAPQKKLYMQEVTNEQLATLMPNEGDSVTLYDKRDENDYIVANLAGAYWMTQNLRIQGTITANLSNFEGNDFNVSVYDLKTNGGNGGECHVPDSYTNVCSHLPDADDLTATGLTEKQIGAWYNFASATAGTITSTSNSSDANEDICPASWHLPNYDTTASSGSINSLNGAPTAIATAFLPVNGGAYVNGSISHPTVGFWWSSTADGSSGRYSLNSYAGNLGAGSGSNFSRDAAIYIRCVRNAS